MLLYGVGKHKCSIGEIRNILGLSYPTVSNCWIRKLRSHLPVSREVLDGTCEVDGSFKSYKELPLLGYKWKACDRSIGFFGPTNHIENLWSVNKRTPRYIYRDLTFDLNDLELILREWGNRYNNPDLFYNEDNHLKTACSELFD